MIRSPFTVVLFVPADALMLVSSDTFGELPCSSSEVHGGSTSVLPPAALSIAAPDGCKNRSSKGSAHLRPLELSFLWRFRVLRIPNIHIFRVLFDARGRTSVRPLNCLTDPLLRILLYRFQQGFAQPTLLQAPFFEVRDAVPLFMGVDLVPCPVGPRISNKVAVVAVRLEFEQRRTMLFPSSGDGLAGRFHYLKHIRAVPGHSWH